MPAVPLRADGERDCATVNGHLHVESGIGIIRLVPAGISPCVQRRRIGTASAGINQRIGEIRRIQYGIIVPKQNRRPESISNPGRRSSITAEQATRDYRCAAALPCIMPMPRSPAPSPSSRVRCPDRCRRADRRAALPTSRPRPPRSSCRPRWWPSGPCRGTCRRP